MAVFNTLSLSKPASDGTYTYSHGLGTTPKVIIATTAGDAGDYLFWSLGWWTQQANDSSLRLYIQDTLDESSALIDTFIYPYLTYVSASTLRVDVTSVDSSSIALSWVNTTNASSSIRLNLLVIGGNDVSVAAGNGSFAMTYSGTLSHTDLGFQPSIVLFIGRLSVSNDRHFSFSMFDGTLSSGGVSIYTVQYASPTVGYSRTLDSSLFNAYDNGTSRCVVTPASVTSNGFTLSVSNPYTSGTQSVSYRYLAIGGINAKVFTDSITASGTKLLQNPFTTSAGIFFASAASISSTWDNIASWSTGINSTYACFRHKVNSSSISTVAGSSFTKSILVSSNTTGTTQASSSLGTSNSLDVNLYSIPTYFAYALLGSAVQEYLQTLHASSSKAVALVRDVGKALRVPSSTPVSLLRGLSQFLPASSGFDTRLSTAWVTAVSFLVSSASNVALVLNQGILKTLTAASATSVQLLRGIGQTLTAVSGTAASVLRGIARTVKAGSNQQASIPVAQKVKTVLVTVPASVAVSVYRDVTKRVSVATSTSAALYRTLAAYLFRASSSTSRVRKRLFRILPVSSAWDASVVKFRSKLVTAASNTTARTKKFVSKWIQLGSSSTSPYVRVWKRVQARLVSSSPSQARLRSSFAIRIRAVSSWAGKVVSSSFVTYRHVRVFLSKLFS